VLGLVAALTTAWWPRRTESAGLAPCESLWTSGGSELSERVCVGARRRPTTRQASTPPVGGGWKGDTIAACAAQVTGVAAVESTARERLLGLPLGPALLGLLGDLNSDVGETLARERAQLDRWGYPTDFQLPALWWAPAPVLGAESAEVADEPTD